VYKRQIYYNLARSDGYNYWTSFGVAAIGSWQWEFFMENEPPALNDWIMTSYGGSILGEMFFRFSNLILDETATGWERFWRELGAGVFNPGRLFNRMVSGRTSRINDKPIYEKRPLLGEIAFGMNNVAGGTEFKDGTKNGMLTLNITYGKLFNQKSFKPFDFFTFNSAFNFVGKSKNKQPFIGQFRIMNILYGGSSPYKSSDFIYGIFGHFDYLENNVYQIGGASLGLSAGYRSSPKSSVQFIGLIHGAALLMGGANSDYAKEYQQDYLDSARTYNMGPGAHAKISTLLRFPYGSFTLNYSYWWVNTWVGAPGDEFIGILSPKLRFNVYSAGILGLNTCYITDSAAMKIIRTGITEITKKDCL
jgi:hypothetical protein